MSISTSIELLTELNQCRSNPRRYSNKLAATLNFYNGMSLERPGRAPVITKEGLKNVEMCIKYLRTVHPSPVLRWSKTLESIAKAHQEDIGHFGLTGHTSSEGADLAVRLQHLNLAGCFGENIDYCNSVAEDIVMSLLIDDGMYGRGQRLNIMKNDHRLVGAAIGPHKVFGMCCVMIFTEDEEGEFGEGTLFLERQSNGCGSEQLEEGLNEDIEISNISGFEQSLRENEEMSLSSLSSSAGPMKQPILKNKPPLPKGKKQIQLSSTLGSDDLSKDTIVEIKEILDLHDSELDSNALRLIKDPDASNSEALHIVCNFELEGISSLNIEDITEKTPVRQKSEKKDKDEEKKMFDPASFTRPNFSNNEIIRIKEAFDGFEVSGSGRIDPKELMASIETKGLKEKNPMIYKIIQSLDFRGLEKVSFEEFLDVISGQDEENISVRELKKIFNVFDAENNGFIDINNLRKVARTTKEFLDESEILEMFIKSDLDQDGRVSFEDFYNLMNKKCYY